MAVECQECGMAVVANAYHPLAACLMFKGCGDAATVEANLNAVRGHGAQYDSGFDDMADRVAALEAESEAAKEILRAALVSRIPLKLDRRIRGHLRKYATDPDTSSLAVDGEVKP